MPNRILRDWTDSFVMDNLDANTERFFVRLIMKVDDYGRFYSDTRLLKSNLFPLKTDIRETDITRWLAACEKSGLITVYTVANKGYLQIENFKQQLRQKTEKFPAFQDVLISDMQMHSRCVADDKQLHTRKEEETEIETEKEGEKKDTPPNFDSINLFPEEKIDNLINTESSERKKVAQKKESDIVDYFHEKCKTLPRVQILSEKRKTSIKARLKDHGEEKVLNVIDLVAESNFLNGENKTNWKADFDFIFNSSNFIKIMEGNYKNREYNVNTNNNGSSQARRR